MLAAQQVGVGEVDLTSEQQEIIDGTLVVRSSKNGGSRVVALAGELDLASAGTAEDVLGSALEDLSTRIVVDMRELEFIDSTGIALLVSSLLGNEERKRISVIPSSALAVTRVLELTGVAERLPLAEA